MKGAFVALICVIIAIAGHSAPRPSFRLSNSKKYESPAQDANQIKRPGRAGYVGDEVCGSCHQDRAGTYSQTAHHLTSQRATKESILGKFTAEENILRTSNPGLLFRMDANSTGFFQTSVWGIPPVTTSRSERFDLVVGSGRKGQTYLFWKGDQLFQLPVSYWVELDQWVNSPGYRDGVADYNRPVVPRCLECHTSYAEIIAGPPPPNHYNPANVVLGIACERCHGPGAAHVAIHRSLSGTNSGEQIVNPAKLPRDRQIEVCAQCHGGPGKRLLAAAFSYIPGQALDQYIERDPIEPETKVDVHGNQVALLQKSRCFQSSPAMNCSTCHNVHTAQRDAAAFSERCLTCHNVENCGIYPKMGRQIANNCVDCHMPKQASNLIVSDSNGRQVRPLVRSHWIKVYPETDTR